MGKTAYKIKKFLKTKCMSTSARFLCKCHATVAWCVEAPGNLTRNMTSVISEAFHNIAFKAFMDALTELTLRPLFLPATHPVHSPCQIFIHIYPRHLVDLVKGKGHGCTSNKSGSHCSFRILLKICQGPNRSRRKMSWNELLILLFSLKILKNHYPTSLAYWRSFNSSLWYRWFRLKGPRLF